LAKYSKKSKYLQQAARRALELVALELAVLELAVLELAVLEHARTKRQPPASQRR